MTPEKQLQEAEVGFALNVACDRFEERMERARACLEEMEIHVDFHNLLEAYDRIRELEVNPPGARNEQ